MKIVEEPLEVYGADLVEVVSADYAGNFVVRVGFSNGIQSMVDFRPFLQNSRHPSIRKYLDEELFQGFDILDGNLNWNDYDLIFPVTDLMAGRI
jgi:hypothetical protein